jgi:2-polyprenyl-3-methyl-5-hydroxy-6-metoxy-1,4-benzoquinol methylase
VWLAEQGFRVTAVDSSADALSETLQLAEERGVSVSCRQVDLESETLDLGRQAYEVICGFNFLHRPLFPALREALKPGGLMIYKTYTVDQLRYAARPRNPLHLLDHNELLRLLEGFRVLRYEETSRGRGTAAIVAQKPA